MLSGTKRKHDHSPDKDPGKTKMRRYARGSDPSPSGASVSGPSPSGLSPSSPSSSGPSPSSPSSSGLSSGGTRIENPSNKLEQQGVASQIIPTLDKSTNELIIDRVQIIGRPEKVFGRTMGDHTTAFAVQREGLEQQLKGKKIPDALDVIKDFYENAKKLPGWELTNYLPTEHKERLERAEKTLADLLNKKSNPFSVQTISALQQAVGAYLEFRELMPLSTINVAAKSQGTAGKGKGEASRINILLNHKSQSKEVLKQAIVDLFDSRSVALAIVEPDKTTLGEMLPGLDDKVSLQDRMEMMIEQHIMSIKQGFSSISQDTINEAKKELKQALRNQVNNALIDDNEFLIKTIKRKQEQIDKNKNSLPDNSKKNKIDERIKIIEDEIQEDKQKQYIINEYYKNIFGRDIDSATRINDKKKTDTGASVKKAVDEEKYKSPLAMQISVDPNDQIIAINSGGRSPSPFSGTMGAHTTAWIVHVDRIRKALKGKTPEEAMKTVETVLVPEADQIKADREKLFEIDPGHKHKLTEAEEDLKNFTTELEGYKGGDAFQILRLQEYLGKLLTYINYIPGSTLDAADTGGKSEGRHRKVLMDFENGGEATPKNLKQAIYGLLDLPADLTGEQRSQLKKQHEQIIKVTYPTAYKAVFENKHSDPIDSSRDGKKRKRKWSDRD
jgi:hypothetical protein